MSILTAKIWLIFTFIYMSSFLPVLSLYLSVFRSIFDLLRHRLLLFFFSTCFSIFLISIFCVFLFKYVYVLVYMYILCIYMLYIVFSFFFIYVDNLLGISMWRWALISYIAYKQIQKLWRAACDWHMFWGGRHGAWSV